MRFFLSRTTPRVSGTLWGLAGMLAMVLVLTGCPPGDGGDENVEMQAMGDNGGDKRHPIYVRTDCKINDANQIKDVTIPRGESAVFTNQTSETVKLIFADPAQHETFGVPSARIPPGQSITLTVVSYAKTGPHPYSSDCGTQPGPTIIVPPPPGGGGE